LFNYLEEPDEPPKKKKKWVWTDAEEEEFDAEKKVHMDSVNRKLQEGNSALSLNSNIAQMAWQPGNGINPAVLGDANKFRTKVYLPKNSGVNYIGLLIGPRGMYQKRLEEESGCKILIRGK
jgi:hypothetical protein